MHKVFIKLDLVSLDQCHGDSGPAGIGCNVSVSGSTIIALRVISQVDFDDR